MTHTLKTSRQLLILCGAICLAALPATIAQASETFQPRKAQTAQAAENGDLIVNINGIETAEGEILIGIFNSQDSYEKDNPIAERIIPAKTGQMSVKFTKLKAGDYAIKVLHDEDKDEEMDLSIIGAPSESFGFSRNARDPFSQPEWDEAKFTLTDENYTANIDIK